MKKAFTLLELLIVIAIIGVLASIVMASLNSSRNKSTDAGMKTAINSLRSAGSIIFNEYGCYAGSSGACFGTNLGPGACSTPGSTIFSNFEFAKITAPYRTNSDFITSCSSASGQTAWAVVIRLKSDNTKAWCVDSLNTAKEVSNGGTAFNQTTLNNTIVGGVCN